MQQKQAGNPDYSFLQPGGPGGEYYRWLLWCLRHGHPPDRPLAAAGAAGGAAAGGGAAPAAGAVPPGRQSSAAALAALPAEVSSGWGQVLALLTGSRDSIRNSQAWFMACLPYAAGMAEMMLQVRAEGRLGEVLGGLGQQEGNSTLVLGVRARL